MQMNNFFCRKENKNQLVGKEIFEITPIILGGNPVDLSNKIILNRTKHIELVNYWNKIIKDLKSKK